MEEEIKLRKVSFDPIKTSARLDGNSGKVRDIGVECIKQQIYDYVATNGLKELFHSDSEYFREKYNVDKIFEKAKRRVSRESKIYRKTGSCNLECAA